MLIPTINSGQVRTTQTVAPSTVNGGFAYRDSDGALFITDTNGFIPPVSYVGGIAVDAMGAVVTTIVNPVVGGDYQNNGLPANRLGEVLVVNGPPDVYDQGLPFALAAGGFYKLCINPVA